MENISIWETSKFSDFWSYLFLLTQEGLLTWIWYVLVVKILGGKNSKLVIIKNNKEIIGGFLMTDFPLVKYKPYNWFKKEAQLKIKELIKNGYQYFCCFLVKGAFRGKGIGTFVFEQYLKKNNKKIYFTSSSRAESFYIRNGAKVFYKSKYNIYVFNGNK